jgi:acetyltransferase
MTEQSLDITLSEAGSTELTTRNGDRLTLRPVTPADAERVDRFYEGLTAEDLRFRFLSAQPHLSDALLTSLIDIDHRHREHLLAFASSGELVASLLIAADPGFETAEVAIAVAPAFKGRGVGWSLLHHAVDLARERGIKRLQSIESRANRGAIEIEHALGFRSSDYDGDATLALLEIDL